MIRRDFLRGTLAAGVGAEVCLRNKLLAGGRTGASTGPRVDLNKSVYAGERYTAVVPDTLDLVERAELALNGIGGTIDPAMHYTMFFEVSYACKTPYMVHSGSSDIDCDTKYGESFPMMRLMCGSNRYADVEVAQRAELMSRIRDGLYWNIYDPARPWRIDYGPAVSSVVKAGEDLSNVFATGRMLRALVTWRELDRDPKWDMHIRELVRGLTRIAIRRADYSYYPVVGLGGDFVYTRSGWVQTEEAKSEVEGQEGSVVCYHGHQIQGLARWYGLSGDTEALDLAARLSRYCMLPRFWGGLPDPNVEAKSPASPVAAVLPDPACVAGNEQGHWYSHFHACAIGLRGMLEYGMVAEDWRIIEFVRRAYEYTWTLGIPRIGWVNTYPVRGNLCEGCALGDLVALGIRLSDARLGDYWDDVDAIVRNHLVEQQLVRADLLEKIASASPPREQDQASVYPDREVRENVIARSLGNFAGQSTPTSVPKAWVMQCCTGNGTQGLYYAWEGIVREEDDHTQVNLLLNRAAKSVDVGSYLPYEGRVVIHNKTARRASVRIPSWVGRGAVRGDVSGERRPGVWVGNYLSFVDLKPGDKITLQFPVPESTARYTVNSRTSKETTYTCTFRGSTLVDISPRDGAPTSYPLYLREHMRKDKAPMKKTTRFVPGRAILKW